MPYLETRLGEKAPAELRALHEEIVKTVGLSEVPNLYRCASLDYDLSKWMWEGSKTVMLRESTIARPLKELIAVVVSETNACQYCVDRHSSVLRAMGFEEELIGALGRDHRSAQLSPAEKAALDFAVKVTRNAYKVTEKDHALLRSHGYTDPQILEIATVASLFNFVNRFVLALS